ncbi:MAG: DNA-processing protein DprA [Planctomycetaceae bacterium]
MTVDILTFTMWDTPLNITINDSPSERLIESLRLNLIPGIGPRLTQLLLDRFGSPAAILSASLAELQQVQGIGSKLAMSIATRGSREEALAEWQRCQSAGVRLLLQGDGSYSPALDRIPDPPSLLYCQGELKPGDELAVAIVGSRRCTPYGEQQAERIAAGLANAGITVVSGLARGIDGAAHRGALRAGGRTIAVCATGLSSIYPPEHADLAREISQQGALLTESPMLQAPVPGLFPQRNRIISGLSLGVVVIEASRKSGALHTARHAMEQNRDLFAIPGRVDSEASHGCLDLIRDGATLIRNVDDVLQALGPMTTPVRTAAQEIVHHPRELQLSDQERAVLNAVSAEPLSIDQVLRSLDLESSRILATLTVLEMKKLIRRLPGGFLIRQ